MNNWLVRYGISWDDGRHMNTIDMFVRKNDDLMKAIDKEFANRGIDKPATFIVFVKAIHIEL